MRPGPGDRLSIHRQQEFGRAAVPRRLGGDARKRARHLIADPDRIDVPHQVGKCVAVGLRADVSQHRGVKNHEPRAGRDRGHELPQVMQQIALHHTRRVAARDLDGGAQADRDAPVAPARREFPARPYRPERRRASD